MSRLSDANKFHASCYSNEEAGTINVSPSNSTVESNATNRVNGYAMFKRKRGGTEELENERSWSRPLSDLVKEGYSNKLRLSREQCALLEESFVKNTIPDPVSLFMLFNYYILLLSFVFRHDLDCFYSAEGKASLGPAAEYPSTTS